MKQLIVMVAMIILGLAIFGLIAGKKDSVYSTVSNVWEKEADSRVLYDEPLR